MMTPEEFAAAQATLANAETERAALEQQVRDCIEKAREYNDAGRATRNKITGLDRQLAPLRAQMQEYAVEQKRILAERQRAEAEAKARQAAEAKAAEQSELQKVQAENAALKEQLAAKG